MQVRFVEASDLYEPVHIGDDKATPFQVHALHLPQFFQDPAKVSRRHTERVGQQCLWNRDAGLDPRSQPNVLGSEV